MARDLDFSPRQRSAPISKPPVSSKTPLVNTLPRPAQPKASKVNQFWLWVIIILLVVLGTWAMWQYFKPSSAAKVTSTTVSSNSDSANVSAKSAEQTLATNATKIQIYDSGAGATSVKAVQAKLVALGYTVENLEKSQFNYDQTYVWYRAELLAEAEKIASTMTDRVVTLKETKIAGSFDLLILLGAK